MAHHLRAHAALQNIWAQIPVPMSGGTQLLLTPVSGNQMPSALSGHQAHTLYTCIHAGTHIYI